MSVENQTLIFKDYSVVTGNKNIWVWQNWLTVRDMLLYVIQLLPSDAPGIALIMVNLFEYNVVL